ncbi:hypothetical protein NPIL_372851 [Nephila pilipes]|uniref:Uncharacterized protein n=1 Tax=Nephila pilipes TaxID=299642 RepID=A0A8X6NML7_NEPPI|nr:hypothetical protein NPIL_372851 [Nephila pilipes]
MFTLMLIGCATKFPDDREVIRRALAFWSGCFVTLKFILKSFKFAIAHQLIISFGQTLHHSTPTAFPHRSTFLNVALGHYLLFREFLLIRAPVFNDANGDCSKVLLFYPIWSDSQF